MLKILVCEDDKHVNEAITFALSKDYSVSSVKNGLEAIDLLEEEMFHLVITDIIMPNIDGYELLEYMDDIGCQIPVVILSSLNTPTNQLEGYQYNIEDYITKPFNIELLKIKIDTIMNRLYVTSDSNVIFDELNLTVKINEELYEFTPTEFVVLQHLFVNKGKYCSKHSMLMLFWSEDSSDRVVDYTIKRIRKKLGDQAGLIKTKVKVGYMYDEE